MHSLEQEIELIQRGYRDGGLSQEERDHLLAEIRDIRVAVECAEDEVLARKIFDACNIAMSIV
ncbi:MAG: hypothetical protein ACO3IA_06390 [Candidatus Nanopelagicales bacterium]